MASSREPRIRALLRRSEQDLAKIEAEYNNSLRAASIDADLAIDIKNFTGNLRSVLDYLAHDIRERYCPKAPTNAIFYFPILSDAASFKSKMSTWYPGLDSAAPQLYSLLASVQPYASAKNAWLGQFNRLNTENKHADLVEQKKTETRQVRVITQGGGEVSWNPANVTFGSGVLIGGVPVNPATQMPAPSATQNVEVTTWVDFRFAGLDVSALGLLREAMGGVKMIETEVQKFL